MEVENMLVISRWSRVEEGVGYRTWGGLDYPSMGTTDYTSSRGT